MKFKVGDRVRAIDTVDKLDLAGKCGTVVRVGGVGHWWDVGVEFDEPFTCGHDCNGRGKRGHCRYGCEREFKLIKHNQKIVITADGKETLARLYKGNKVIKTAVAKCHPDDAFDFMVGATVAFNRIITPAEEEPKYFKGKAVCLEDNKNHTITKGKIYDFSENDGCGKNDIGTKIVNHAYTSLDDINDAFREKSSLIRFLEIKE